MRNGSSFGTIGAAFAVVAAIGSSPSTAQALSCATEFWRLPETGATDVPTNAVLWGYVGRYTRLVGPSGDVDLDELGLVTGAIGISAGATTLPVLVPRSELEPNTEYTIITDVPSTGERIAFRTTSGPATATPPRPVLVGAESGTGSSWLGSGATRWQTLDFEGIAAGRLTLLGDIADAEGGDAAVLDTFASLRELLIGPTERPGPVLEWLSNDETLTVGATECSIWPEGAADRQDARFGAFDLAGNFSGWVDVAIELPSREEAQAELDQVNADRELERAEASRQNLQEPRSAIANCSTATPAGARGTGSAWLALSLGLCVAAYRRRAKR